MPRLRDRSIGLTISLSFAGVLTLMAVLVGLTLLQIEQTRHYHRVLMDEVQPAIDNAEAVQHGVQRLNDLLLTYLVSGDAALRVELRETDEKLGRELSSLPRLAHPGQERAAMQRLYREATAVRAGLRQTLDGLERYGRAMAFERYRGQVRPHVDPAVEAADDLQGLKNARMTQLRELLIARGDRSWLFLLIGFFAVAAGCIVLARLTIARIIIPARRLVVAARVLEHGDYSRAIEWGAAETDGEAETEAEIPRLRQSFVRMARALQEREERLLEQARHLETTNNRLAALQSITDVALTHLELDELLGHLVERVVAATAARAGAILLLEETGQLRARATHGLTPEMAEAMFNPPGAPWAAWLDEAPEPLLLPRPGGSRRLEDTLPEGYPVGSMVVLPLIAGEKAIGLAHVDGAQPEQFGEEAVGLMRVFAERVALAIERARAFAALEDWNQILAQRLAEQQEKLVRTERLASLGLIGAGIAHELRNPLGVITNSVYYLRQRLRGGDEKVLRHAEIIEREVAHAVRIIDSLVQFSNRSAPAAYPVDLRGVLNVTVGRADLPATVELRVEVPDDLPPVLADEQRLTQVLENLIRNAEQAMEGHGSILVSAARSGTEVTIRVRDTGPGIPPEHRERIFEPLFSTKVKGMGLGLALSKKMIEAWGGRISAASHPEGGAEFRIDLPVAPSPPILPARAEAARER